MVNPLMGAKMEPLGSMDTTCSAANLGFVKLELDTSDKEDDKVEVKMEMLGELFGDNFGAVNSLLSESDSISFGPPPTYPGTSSSSPGPGADIDTHTSIVRTVKVPIHADVGDENYPPVLSIPASFAAAGLTSPSGSLQISISPISQGADTTSLGSPPTPLSASSSTSSSSKKTVFTAKAQIEAIPCKVCGDKSSGVHYGVITCEGCKGFFRRSQSQACVTNYQCPRQKNCVVDRVNRNRCQFCRLQKCLALGMSRDAVKFGRMSKKQREVVEKEVSFHQQHNRRPPGNSPDSSHREPPSSTETMYPNTQFQYLDYNCGNQFQTSFQTNSFDEFVDSTTSFTETDISIQTGIKVPNVSGADRLGPGLPTDRPVMTIKQEVPAPGQPLDPGFVDSTTFPGRPTPPLTIQEDTLEKLQNDPERIRQHLSETVLSAHNLTCLFDSSQIQAATTMPVDHDKIFEFKNKSQEDLWMAAAQQLTDVITQIIEFAKMLPGFLKFPQEDQIVLLKAGSFELALLRMSRYYCVDRKIVLFMNTLLPVEAFMGTGNTCEMKLVTDIFDFVKSLAEMELSETALALYSAYILLQHDRVGLKNVDDIRTVGTTILQTLESELNNTSNSSFNILTGDNNIFQQLVNKRHRLRDLSSSHLEVLRRFKRSCRNKLQFPPLHGELFPDS